MAEGGEGNRREIPGRLVEGEPVEEVMEAGAGARGRDQEEHGRQRPEEADGITPGQLKRYLFVTYFLMFISILSIIGNCYLVLSEKEILVGVAGAVVSVCFLIASMFAFIVFDDHKNARRVRSVVPKVDALLLEALGQIETTTVVVPPNRQAPAIDSGNPSAESPADPAVAGPSGLQPATPHVPDEHSYRTLRSGKKIPVSESRRSERQSVLQAPVSRESSVTRRISEVAASLSQITAAHIGGRKRTNRKEPIQGESISEDSDDSAHG